MEDTRTHFEGEEGPPERSRTDTVRETARHAGDQVTEHARGISEDIKEQAQEGAARARHEVEERYADQRNALVEELESVERALHSAADTLTGEGREATAGHFRRVAEALGRLSTEVRGKSFGGLIAAVDDYGRQEPMMMFAGAAAAGFALSRFLKSSGGQDVVSSLGQQPAEEV
jgi:ElaB/YqjD/DUF883 family membrane-anchored ribosome-binding protein